MGLSKLLAVGRSVRSVTKEPVRYKMTQQNLLPTFGGTKAAEAHDAEVAQPAAPAMAKASPTNSATGEASGVAPNQFRSARADAFVEATKKLRPFGGGSWFKNLFARPAPSKQLNVPVQTELSLDSVRPVRNELNEPELELGKHPGCGAEFETSGVAKGVPVSPAPATGSLWQRVKARLFGANDEK